MAIFIIVFLINVKFKGTPNLKLLIKEINKFDY